MRSMATAAYVYNACYIPSYYTHAFVGSYFNSQGLIASETEFMLVDLYINFGAIYTRLNFCQWFSVGGALR